jgi:hypothetical protein
MLKIILLQNIVGDHPSFFKFLNDIIREEQNTSVAATQALVGAVSNSKRAKYQKIDERIQHMVQEFNNVSREDFFKIARSVFNF